MFFVISKLFWIVAEPINFILILGIIGVLLSFGRTARLGRGLAAISIVMLAIAGFSPLGALLLRPLEDRFPQPSAQLAAPTGIIVLGGALNSDLTAARGVPTLPESAARLTTGVALARRFPTARLIFTGGSASISGKGEPEAPYVRNLWLSLGVSADRMVFEAKSRNTWENAVFTRALIDPKPDQTWLLVTSAWHMPRSMGIFRQAGFNVIAYPVDYQTFGDDRDLRVPRSAPDEMAMLDTAIHEWIGLVAYHLTGKIATWFPAPRGSVNP
ncbi:MAG: YdcF family protein [Methylovirgula sp.]